MKGVVHGDLKVSNVMVEPGWESVNLDQNSITISHHHHHHHHHHHMTSRRSDGNSSENDGYFDNHNQYHHFPSNSSILPECINNDNGNDPSTSTSTGLWGTSLDCSLSSIAESVSPICGMDYSPWTPHPGDVDTNSMQNEKEGIP